MSSFKNDDYCFNLEEFNECCLKFGTPVVDLFCAGWNKKAGRGFTKEDSAFNHSWRGFGLCWCNPPFTSGVILACLLKAHLEKVSVIFCLPVWDDKIWWKFVESYMNPLYEPVVYRPKGRLFCSEGGRYLLTSWAVIVFRVN